MASPDIGLIGLAQSGKDTFARILMEEDPRYSRVAFADPVRDMALRLDPTVYACGYVRLSELVLEEGWDAAKRHPDVRRLLQRLGTDAVRTVAPQFWVDRAHEAADRTGGPVVFTDARFPNECKAIRDVRGGVIVRLVRPGTETAIGAATAHASEDLARNVTIFPDFTITNDGTLEDLRREVRHLLNELSVYHITRPI